MTIKLCDKSRINAFDFFYFFLVVFYMAQMTPQTARMVAGLSAPWIPFLLPFVLTVILLIRHKVPLTDKKLLRLMLICLVWEVAVTVHKKLFTLSDQSFQFFLFYTLIFAYVHVRSFGRRIVPLFETVIVILCKMSIPFWIAALLFPGPMKSFATLFPPTDLGNNILFIFNYIDPLKSEQFIRNSGCSWEPGRFAIMIALGLFCNIVRRGVRFRGNRNALWMIAVMLSTMSTTGYSIVILMYAITILKKSRLAAKIGYLIVLIPVIIYLFSLDFMGSKISDQLNVESAIEERMDNMDYYDKEFGEDEYVSSLGRFESMYLEWFNIIHDPILGYGRNDKHSYFREENQLYFSLTGGLLKVFSMYGLLLGTFFYVLLYRSSKRINLLHGNKTTDGMLFWVILLSSVSYLVFTIPVFTAFWMFDYFENKKDPWTLAYTKKRLQLLRRRAKAKKMAAVRRRAAKQI